MVHAEPRPPRATPFEAFAPWRSDRGWLSTFKRLQQQGKLFSTAPRVDENLSLREAHRQATQLEEGIRELRTVHQLTFN